MRPAFLTRSEIQLKFGAPGKDYNDKYMTTWNVKEKYSWFPEDHIYINRDFAVQLDLAFAEIQAAGLTGEIKKFDGCFVVRNTRGASTPSLHSWGMAMDLNASVERLGQTATHWSDGFLNIMRKYVYWGGDFHGRKDPMHFSLYGD